MEPQASSKEGIAGIQFLQDSFVVDWKQIITNPMDALGADHHDIMRDCTSPRMMECRHVQSRRAVVLRIAETNDKVCLDCGSGITKIHNKLQKMSRV